MRHWITTFALLMVLLAAQAHEFWLQADRYFLKTGEKAQLKFMVGENFMGEPWDLKVHRVESLQAIESDGVRSLADSVNRENSTLSVRFNTPGTKLLAMQSNPAYIELEAKLFNEYLQEDGLDDVYASREKNKALGNKAREHYSRHTKLFLQVGETRDDIYKKIVGMPIELIPQRNPYELKRADKCQFLVLFNGQPLFGAKVRIWNRFDNRTTIQNAYTQKDGMIEMQISNPGSWMVSVVKMVPSKDPAADWRSYWGSLVFAVKP
ncbi:DUF4198 domain-containing protein [Chryseolinea sp. T2]|uniref:DUF4198 domain-containing protein n=1 Tax=Chryseolinea sp. T2 TaxID=3129255 RepID=UPI0030783C61